MLCISFAKVFFILELDTEIVKDSLHQKLSKTHFGQIGLLYMSNLLLYMSNLLLPHIA